MKTRAEIEALKTNWLEDPCYDLEDAEGFEEYRDELLAYRLEMEDYWNVRTRNRRSKRAEELGIPGNLNLVELIERLEARIEKLEGS